MSRKKQKRCNLEPEMVAMIIAERESQSSASGKRQVVLEYVKLLDSSKSTIYNNIRKVKQGHSSSERIDKGSVRISNPETFDRDLLKIAGMQAESGCPTDMAIQILYHAKLIDKEYEVSTVRRHLRNREINLKNLKKKRANDIRTYATYSNQCWQVDATVAKPYYLGREDKLEYHPSIPIDFSHGDDRLRKQSLKKIWVYYFVDVCSGIYDCIAFAGTGLGENSADWYKAFFYFTSKYGIPEMVYSDKGSGLKSGMMQNFFKHFDIKFESHAAGCPQGKGKIERTIGVQQQRFEVMTKMLEKKISSIDSYNNFMRAWAKDYNHKKKRDVSFQTGFKSKMFVPTVDQLSDAVTMPFTRNIAKWGIVQIDNQDYYVSSELYKGTKVLIYKKHDGRYYAETMQKDIRERQIFKCVLDGYLAAEIGEEFKKYSTSEQEEIQLDVIAEGKKLKKMLDINDLLPQPIQEENNIVNLSFEKETNIKAPQDKYTSQEQIWLIVSRKTGLYRSEIAEEICQALDDYITAHLQLNGNLADEQVLFIINKINEYQVKKEKKNG